MTKNNSVVAIFKFHIEAETAVKELQQPACASTKTCAVEA
jgi:hypothetical protein